MNAGDGDHEFSWAKRLANGIPNEFIYQKAQCLHRSAQNMGRVPIPADAIVAHQVDGEAGKLVSPPFGLICDFHVPVAEQHHRQRRHLRL